jgi:hypothetical protein
MSSGESRPTPATKYNSLTPRAWSSRPALKPNKGRIRQLHLELADGWVNAQEKVHHANVRRLDGADLTLNVGELKGPIIGLLLREPL